LKIDLTEHIQQIPFPTSSRHFSVRFRAISQSQQTFYQLENYHEEACRSVDRRIAIVNLFSSLKAKVDESSSPSFYFPHRKHETFSSIRLFFCSFCGTGDEIVRVGGSPGHTLAHIPQLSRLDFLTQAILTYLSGGCSPGTRESKSKEKVF
jgi:hypothetical protein